LKIQRIRWICMLLEVAWPQNLWKSLEFNEFAWFWMWCGFGNGEGGGWWPQHHWKCNEFY
jgi:hypothetical protein